MLSCHIFFMVVQYEFVVHEDFESNIVLTSSNVIHRCLVAAADGWRKNLSFWSDGKSFNDSYILETRIIIL